MMALRSTLTTLAIVWLSVPTLATEKDAQIIAAVVYLHPQRLVAIESSRRVNVYCKGTGSPTVVFDSGRGDDLMVWALVQPTVSAETRACSYDRAGLGFSDPSSRARTSANAVEDLHRLLRAAHLPPPYVLVGHSL